MSLNPLESSVMDGYVDVMDLTLQNIVGAHGTVIDHADIINRYNGPETIILTQDQACWKVLSYGVFGVFVMNCYPAEHKAREAFTFHTHA